MRYRILKSFPLSRDGIRSELLVAGDTADIPDDAVKGLTREGFIGPVASLETDARPESTPVAAAASVDDAEPAEEAAKPRKKKS